MYNKSTLKKMCFLQVFSKLPFCILNGIFSKFSKHDVTGNNIKSPFYSIFSDA